MKLPATFPYSMMTVAACAAIILTLSNKSEGSNWWPFGKKQERGTAEIVINEAPLSRDTKVTTSFAGIIQKASPSVVSVRTSRTISMRRGGGDFPFNDPLFRRFFGEAPEGDPAPQERQQPGLGSGVIISMDGYILTNNHVIDGVDEIIVEMQENGGGTREMKAAVVGADPRSDLAVLKVDAENLPAVTLGNSDHIEVGDVVLAIGNPFGIGQTVTMGIVSATGRNIGVTRGGYENFIQTDASINRGNSGGALVDAEGRLVGVNTAIISPSGGNLGIGFAIPINMARSVMQQIIETGTVSRGYLGVMIEPVSKDRAELEGLPAATGVIITNVEKGFAAEQAGLQRGDIILEFNGQTLRDLHDLRLKVASEVPGAEITLKIRRSGKNIDKKVVLSRLPDETGEAAAPEAPPEADPESDTILGGIEIRDIDSAARQRNNIPAEVNGVLVTRVAPDSPASRAEIRPGMVLLEIGSAEIASTKEARDAARALRADMARILIWERGAFRYIVLRGLAK